MRLCVYSLLLSLALGPVAHAENDLVQTQIDDNKRLSILPTVRIAGDTDKKTTIDLSADLQGNLTGTWLANGELGVSVAANKGVSTLLKIANGEQTLSPSYLGTAQMTFTKVHISDDEYSILKIRRVAAAAARDICNSHQGNLSASSVQKCKLLDAYHKADLETFIPLDFFILHDASNTPLQENTLTSRLPEELKNKVIVKEIETRRLLRNAKLKCLKYDDEKVNEALKNALGKAASHCSEKLPPTYSSCINANEWLKRLDWQQVPLEMLVIDGTDHLDVALKRYYQDSKERKTIRDSIDFARQDIPDTYDEKFFKQAEMTDELFSMCEDGLNLFTETATKQRSNIDDRKDVPKYILSFGVRAGARQIKWIDTSDGVSVDGEYPEGGFATYFAYTKQPSKSSRIGFSFEMPFTWNRKWSDPAGARNCANVLTVGMAMYEKCDDYLIGEPKEQHVISLGLLAGAVDVKQNIARVAIGPIFEYRILPKTGEPDTNELAINGRVNLIINPVKYKKYDSTEYRGLVLLGLSAGARRAIDKDTKEYQWKPEAILTLELLGRRPLFGRALDWL